MSATQPLPSRSDASTASSGFPTYLVAAATGLALIVFLTIWLWWRYGTALFVDMAVSALNICF